MSKIFISYRHVDSEYIADSIYRRLLQTFDREQLFKDVDNIPLGVDFKRYLDSQVAQCEVVLVVIGPDWVSATNEWGERRLDDPSDFVRIEVESALERRIPIIPLLVKRASMPRSQELPGSLSALVLRHGMEVRPARDFDRDMERLVQRLKEIIRVVPPEPEPSPVQIKVPDTGDEGQGNNIPNKSTLEAQTPWPNSPPQSLPEPKEPTKHHFDNNEVKLILRFRQYPQRYHLEKYLDLVRELILFTGLKDGDRRIALTIPGYNNLPVNINNRYVLSMHGDRSGFGMLVTLDYIREILGADFTKLKTKEERLQALEQSSVAKENGVTYAGSFGRIGAEEIEQIPYWLGLTKILLEQENLDPKLFEAWRAAVLYEMNRAVGSPYRKFHQSVVYKASLDLEYRKTLLDAAYSDEEFKLKPVQWNGRDFYVSFGVGEHRQWEDAQRYGFVSGGQGEWYSRTLKAIKPGSRVFVRIPKKGYVGIGEVEESSVPVKEFMVEVDGVQKNILEAPLLAQKMDENADDLSNCEYLVRVKWIKTVSIKDAVWESDMFVNRNTACKLTDEVTVEKLVAAFGAVAKEYLVEGKPTSPTILIPNGNQMAWGQGNHAGEVRELPEMPDARLVWCPPGRFEKQHINNEEGQPTEVVLTNGFWLWQTPVTQSQFEAIMGYNPSHFSGDGSLPVECVSWHEAAAFCNRVSRQLGLPEVFTSQGEAEDTRCELKSEYSGNEGKGYYLSPGFRLPTKAELYYSCRAGVNAPLYGEMNEISWNKHNSDNQTHPVAQKQPNAWNLYDLLGNVYVWCWDRWHNKLDIFSEEYVENPVCLKGGSWRLLHGSSWGASKKYTSNESGGRDSAHNRKNWIGFRPAITGG